MLFFRFDIGTLIVWIETYQCNASVTNGCVNLFIFTIIQLIDLPGIPILRIRAACQGAWKRDRIPHERFRKNRPHPTLETRG